MADDVTIRARDFIRLTYQSSRLDNKSWRRKRDLRVTSIRTVILSKNHLPTRM